MLAHKEKSAHAIFGSPDDLKFQSSMTLFHMMGEQRVFLEAISTHPMGAVLSDAVLFAKPVTLSLALRSSGDAGRGFGRVGTSAALVAG